MTVSNNQEIKPEPIDDLNSLNLKNHMIIEASAGTGKTYTLENIVVSLLEQGLINSIEEVLIVTFTEKATGELRTRIRSRLEEKLSSDSLHPEVKSKFQDSIDNYDLSSIFTIHGFCNKVLQQYSYESGEQFKFDVVDDNIIYPQIIHKILREQWSNNYDDDLQTLIRISSFPSYDKGTKSSRWIDRVIDIAKKYNPIINDVLNPSIEQNLSQYLSNFIHTLKTNLFELKDLLGPIEPDSQEISSCYIAYSNLNIKKASLNKRLRIILSLIKLVSEIDEENFDIQKIISYFNDSKLENFEILNSGWKKEGPDFDQKFPHLLEIINILENLRTMNYSYIVHQLAVQTISKLKTEVAVYKKSRGYISYEDMISLVCQSIEREDSILAKVLHEKYKYALVDEFQDTDLMQWNIFKTIFLQSPSSKLLIIGDPKQAIYGFRGADIFAYFTARETMIKTFEANYYTLNRNYRSSPGLIHIFNMIFSYNNWFLDERIKYIENFYPESKDDETNILDTNDLSIINLGQCTGRIAKKKTASATANEIFNLITEQNIHPKNIAILVRKWNEAEEIENTLSERGIPFSYYKKEGLFQGIEALHISYLISAVSNPSNMSDVKKALLTDFFKISAEEIDRNDSIANYPEIHELFEKLIHFSDTKQWSKFFHSIIEDTGIFYSLISNKEEQSRIKNYQHIIQVLSFECFKENFDIQMLNQFLNSLIRGNTDSSNNANIHKIELEEPGVQLLTIHASKGLQFDIVFIAGGFTSKDLSEYDIFHEKNHRIISLARDENSKNANKWEMDCEETRLFYVALTRAKKKLFVPIFEPTKQGKSSAGILGTRMANAIDHLKTIENINILDYQDDFTMNSKLKKENKKSELLKFPDPLFIDEHISFINRNISVESFSSIKSSSTKEIVLFNETLDPDPTVDEIHIIGDEEEPSDDTAQLPKGRNTGSMLHEIIEEIDFKEVHNTNNYEDIINSNAQSNILIERKINQYFPILENEKFLEYKDQTAKLIWNTLKSPIVNDTPLCNIKNKLHETEFFFYMGKNNYSSLPDIQKDQNGFIRGFIDLIFEINNKYYILDWKSNYIEEGYTHDLLKKNIRSSSYDLQYKIYIIALNNWLKQVKPGFNFDQHFGGVFYLYLRGMDSKDTGKGVYFYKPESEKEVSDFSKELFQSLD